MFVQVWHQRCTVTLLIVLTFAGTGWLWSPVAAADTADDIQSSASVSGQTCSAPTCAKPPAGCSYESASACECGTLMCVDAISAETDEPLQAVVSADSDSGQTTLLAVILSAIAGLTYLAHVGTNRALHPQPFDVTRENRRHPTFHD